jgi:hypothetical protein
MADIRVNGGEQTNDAQRGTDQIGGNRIDDFLGSISEEERKVLAAHLAREISEVEAKKDIVAETLRSSSAAAQNDITAEAVRVASLEAKKAAVVEAVESAHDGAKQEVVTQAVSVAPLEAKKAAAAEAVNSAAVENKVNVAAEGVEQLSPKQQKELVDRLPITPVTADEIWRTVVGAFKWVLWGATLALVAAIGVALFREVDQALVQILLTVFTTVAGIFAGFIGGKALGTSNG